MIGLLIAIAVVWAVAMVLLRREFQRLRHEHVVQAWVELTQAMRDLKKAFAEIGAAGVVANQQIRGFGNTLREVWTEPGP